MNVMVHLAVLIPVSLIALAFLLPVMTNYNFKYLKELAACISIYNLILSIYIIYIVISRGPIEYHFGNWSPPWGIEFYIGNLEAIMIMLMTSVFLMVIIYAPPFIKKEISEKVKHWYYVLLFLLQSSLVGMIATNDLFNFFVFVEICAIASVAIISVKDKRDSIEASLKYLFLSSAGSAFILFAIGLLFMVTGHLNMNFVGEVLQERADMFPQTIKLSLVFMFIGLGLKAALFPLHIWLPDAYTAAPTSSTALLAGLVGKAYVIGLIKILFQVYRLDILQRSNILSVILFLSALAIIMGSVFAIGQENIKRLLAYSSVAQVGYIFLGIGLISEKGMSGGLLHVFNHALIKTLLFLSVGVIIYKTGKNKISDFKGIGHEYPFTMLIFSISALAMVGIPPLNGFISKWFLAIGTLEAGRPVYLVVILVSSLLNAIYYLPIIINAFFGTSWNKYNWEFQRLNRRIWAPMIIMAIALIFFGFFPNLPLYFIEKTTALFLSL